MKVHKGRRFRWGKAVLSYLLIISMVLGLIPQSAYAAGVETASTNEVYEDVKYTAQTVSDKFVVLLSRLVSSLKEELDI